MPNISGILSFPLFLVETCAAWPKRNAQMWQKHPTKTPTKRKRHLAYLVAEGAFPADHFLEDVFSDVRIHGAQWVIQQIHIGVVVHGPRQRHPLLLSSAQVDALETDK